MGDAIVLGKPIGVGVLSAALKKGMLPEEGYAELIKHTCKINKPGMALSKLEGVHAMTDVIKPLQAFETPKTIPRPTASNDNTSMAPTYIKP